MKNRLKEIREAKGLRLKDVESLLLEKTGEKWSLKTISNFENGQTNASEDLLKSLAEVLGVEVADILTGEKTEAPVLREAQPVYATRIRWVPVISWAGCGAIGEQGLSFEDLEAQIDEQMPTECKDPNAFALIMEGHSMEMEVLPGDRVVFAPNEEPRNGDVVVARFREDGGVVVKRYRQFGPGGQTIRLESVNPDYETKEYRAEEFRFIYPAVDLRRRMRR